MKLELFGLTDRGLIREHNEDAILLAHQTFQVGGHKVTEEEDVIAAVADGLGGLHSGEIASRLCLEELESLKLPYTVQTIIEKINFIHKKIIAYGNEHDVSKGMATTVTGIFSSDGQFYTFHVGDSRVYRYRQGFLKQLTYDHSLVQVMYENGMIKKNEIDTHPNKHIVLKVLGGTKDVSVEPEITEVRGGLRIEDVFLICTDGLSDLVDLIEMERCFIEGSDLSAIANRLLDKAKEKGGGDNVSIILAKRVE